MNTMKLLPTSFKRYGIVTSLIALLFFIFINIFHKKNPVPHFELIKEITKSVIILGCVFIIFSREKIEDERINSFRLNAFMFSFLVVIFSFILNPIFNSNTNKSFFNITFQMCLQYLLWYYFLKMNLFRFFKAKNEE
jgi:hypothetical protein